MSQINKADTSASQASQGDSDSAVRQAPRWPMWLGFLLPILIVFFVALGFYYFELLPQQSNLINKVQPKVEIGKDYYVLVPLVELSSTNASDESWDSYNNSAPDVRVEIYWKNQRVYRSSTKTDSFVAKWSNAEFDLIGMALSGKSTSVDEALQAARINIRQGDEIEVRVYDEDMLGSSEEAGKKQFTTSDLHLGDTVHNLSQPGLRRIILRVLDMDTPPDIFK